MLVFLFLGILIAVLILAFVFSKLRLEIIDFEFNSLTKRHINQDYEFVIKLYLLSVLPILKVHITKAKLEKMQLKEKMKQLEFKLLNDKNHFDKRMLMVIKKIKFSIKEIHLHIKIGTENASFTSIVVAAISTVIAILLRKKMKEFEQQKFSVHPVYQNQNLVNIHLSGIFEIKIGNIISIMYQMYKTEKKGVKRYERTSNRRPYGYGYE